MPFRYLWSGLRICGQVAFCGQSLGEPVPQAAKFCGPGELIENLRKEFPNHCDWRPGFEFLQGVLSELDGMEDAARRIAPGRRPGREPAGLGRSRPERRSGRNRDVGAAPRL